MKIYISPFIPWWRDETKNKPLLLNTDNSVADIDEYIKLYSTWSEYTEPTYSQSIDKDYQGFDIIQWQWPNQYFTMQLKKSEFDLINYVKIIDGETNFYFYKDDIMNILNTEDEANFIYLVSFKFDATATILYPANKEIMKLDPDTYFMRKDMEIKTNLGDPQNRLIHDDIPFNFQVIPYQFCTKNDILQVNAPGASTYSVFSRPEIPDRVIAENSNTLDLPYIFDDYETSLPYNASGWLFNYTGELKFASFSRWTSVQGTGTNACLVNQISLNSNNGYFTGTIPITCTGYTEGVGESYVYVFCLFRDNSYRQLYKGENWGGTGNHTLTTTITIPEDKQCWAIYFAWNTNVGSTPFGEHDRFDSFVVNYNLRTTRAHFPATGSRIMLFRKFVSRLAHFTGGSDNRIDTVARFEIAFKNESMLRAVYDPTNTPQDIINPNFNSYVIANVTKLNDVLNMGNYLIVVPIDPTVFFNYTNSPFNQQNILSVSRTMWAPSMITGYKAWTQITINGVSTYYTTVQDLINTEINLPINFNLDTEKYPYLFNPAYCYWKFKGDNNQFNLMMIDDIEVHSVKASFSYTDKLYIKYSNENFNKNYDMPWDEGQLISAISVPVFYANSAYLNWLATNISTENTARANNKDNLVSSIMGNIASAVSGGASFYGTTTNGQRKTAMDYNEMGYASELLGRDMMSGQTGIRGGNIKGSYENRQIWDKRAQGINLMQEQMNLTSAMTRTNILTAGLSSTVGLVAGIASSFINYHNAERSIDSQITNVRSSPASVSQPSIVAGGFKNKINLDTYCYMVNYFLTEESRKTLIDIYNNEGYPLMQTYNYCSAFDKAFNTTLLTTDTYKVFNCPMKCSFIVVEDIVNNITLPGVLNCYPIKNLIMTYLSTGIRWKVFKYPNLPPHWELVSYNDIDPNYTGGNITLNFNTDAPPNDLINNSSINFVFNDPILRNYNTLKNEILTFYPTVFGNYNSEFSIIVDWDWNCPDLANNVSFNASAKLYFQGDTQTNSRSSSSNPQITVRTNNVSTHFTSTIRFENMLKPAFTINSVRLELNMPVLGTLTQTQIKINSIRAVKNSSFFFFYYKTALTIYNPGKTTITNIPYWKLE